MNNNNNNKKKNIIVIILILLVFFSFVNIYKGTYSDIILDEIISFDYSLEVDKKEKIIKYIDKDTKISEIINKVSVKGNHSLNVSLTNSDGVKKDKDNVVVTGDLLVINVSDNVLLLKSDTFPKVRSSPSIITSSSRLTLSSMEIAIIFIAISPRE